jgi:predicted methyltransferase
MVDSATISASRHLGSLLLLFAAACAVTAPDYRAILSHAERPENERQLDAARKPEAVMMFYGVRSGDKAADLLAGRGYYTVILSQIVGPDGLVYSTNTGAREEWSDRFKRPPFTNVRTVVGPMDKIGLPQDGSLDFALTHLNYHDLPQPARTGMNKRVLAALRKGGIYGVVDHSAREGSGDSD